VLFAKSGMGKSSLLNAGLTPLLEKTALQPLRIRLSNDAVPLEEQFLQELEREPDDDTPAIFQVQLDPGARARGATLWEQVKNASFTKNGQAAVPLFVFDQFEEVFTLYSPAQRERFLRELADLANGNPPEAYLQNLRDRIGAGEQLDVPALEASPRCKFVFSIRSDLLHLLNGLSPIIPDIMRSRFELLPLDREQAEEAVTLPAMLRDPERQFRSLPFRFDEAALATILQYLTKNGAEEVESFQLQILCRAIELQTIARSVRNVTPALFGGAEGLEHIIRDFYMAKIGELPEADRMPARRLLEEQLITDSGRRRSVAEDELLALPALLNRLVEMRLLRKEPRLRTFYYEISHDTLVGPILEKYRERRQEEEQRAEAARLEAERLEAIRRREEAEALAKEEAAKRRKAENQRRQAWLLTTVAVAGLCFAGWQYWEADRAKEQALDSEKKARQEKLVSDSLKNVAVANQEALAIALQKAEDSDSTAQAQKTLAVQKAAEATKNLRLMQQEKRAKELAEINKLLNDAAVFERAGEYPNAIARLKEVLRRDPENAEAKRRLQALGGGE
jgi:hypothetical protein